MTAVKEIDGTDEYLSLAESKSVCQNERTIQECLMTKLVNDGLKKCNCTPFSFRNFSKQGYS